jgi:hypothetical protein
MHYDVIKLGIQFDRWLVFVNFHSNSVIFYGEGMRFAVIELILQRKVEDNQWILSKRSSLK